MAGEHPNVCASVANMSLGIGPEDGWTYLIQSVTGGPVKIGSTTSSPNERLKTLQTGHPEELRIVGLLLGKWHERRLHATFHERRIRGEWFDESVLEDWAQDRLVHASTISALAISAVFNGESLLRSI